MLWPEAYLGAWSTSKMELFAKTVTDLVIDYFRKTFHFRYLTGFWTTFWWLSMFHKSGRCSWAHPQFKENFLKIKFSNSKFCEVKWCEETAVCSSFKIGVFKILQFWRENKDLCWSLFLTKLHALSKRDSNTGVFLWILQDF